MTNLFQNIRDYYEGGDLHVRGLFDVQLPDNVAHVGGNLVIDGCPNLKTLNIKSVDGNVHIENCNSLESLGDLEYVGGFILIWNCPNLVSIADGLKGLNESLSIINCPKFSDLKNIKYVRGYCDFEGCTSLSNIDGMEMVGDSIYVKNTNVKETKFSNQLKV